jgi:3-hydroxyacyl-[acyl-carrier-protein] dehydratase
LPTVELCDPREWLDKPILFDQAAIAERLPHRYEMALLHGVLHLDEEQRFAIGIHHARETDFWVRGHIPGRPLMPGVVMIEITAQLCAWLGTYSINAAPGKFMGFGGVNHARFRGKVVPGDTLLVATQIQKLRRSLGTFLTQAWVRNELIFEGEILGVVV